MLRINFTNDHTAEVFDNMENGFQDFHKLAFDTALGKAEVGTKEANDKIREIFNQVLGVDEYTSKKELRKAIRRHKIDVFEIIEEIIPDLLKTGWGDNPFFNEYVEYRNLNDGDANEFYTEDDTILTVSKLSGNHHDIIRQRLGEGESFQVKTSWYGIKIYAEFEKFMAGRVDWAAFVQKVYEAFDKKMNTMIYQALVSVTGQVTPSTMFNKSGQMTAANKVNLLELIENVQAATGEEVVILGSKVALATLNNMEDVNWISNSMKEDRNTLGRLAIWEGVRLAEIPQGFTDKTMSTKLVDNTKLLIMPVGDNKFIKVVDEGDAQIYEITDGATNMDMTISYEYQQKLGVATLLNKKFGVWTITQ